MRLMELVVSRENMMAAHARVVGNKGAAGIDKMSVADLKPFLKEHWPRIREELLEDRYQPQSVRGVEIPKPGLAWVRLYIGRWLRAPVEHPDRTLMARTKGTPQGGVISPLLANLFLHYAFDCWMARVYPDLRFERYADDGLVHCRSEAETRSVLEAIRGVNPR